MTPVPARVRASAMPSTSSVAAVSVPMDSPVLVRCTHVRLEEETGRLVLVSNHSNGPVEDATDIPHSQAEALLELAAGPANHAIELARRGLSAGALDLEPAMVRYGLEKAAAAGVARWA